MWDTTIRPRWETYGRYEEDIIPNICLRYSNDSHGRGLANISAIFSCIGTYSSLTTLSNTCSLRKWYLIGMWFIMDFITISFDILIEIVLSQKIDIGWVQSNWMYFRLWIIQSNCVQYDAIAMYSTLAVDKEIELWFLLSQETK